MNKDKLAELFEEFSETLEDSPDEMYVSKERIWRDLSTEFLEWLVKNPS